jgi:DNA-binding LytR/AlgR family response regulator
VDIILMDLHIPGARDSIDIAAELMNTKRVPVVYLMEDADAGAISRAKQTYPVSFLPKPYNSHHVCIAIELAIHNFISCNAPQDLTAEVIDTAGNAIKRKKNDGVDKEVILRQGSSIFIKRNFQFVKISLHEILYMEADGNYVHIVVKDKKFTIRLSLMQVIRRINYSRFVHINRSSVVNVDAIQSFNKEQVVIAQYEIAIGKNYKEAFFRQLGF